MSKYLEVVRCKTDKDVLFSEVLNRVVASNRGLDKSLSVTSTFSVVARVVDQSFLCQVNEVVLLNSLIVDDGIMEKECMVHPSFDTNFLRDLKGSIVRLTIEPSINKDTGKFTEDFFISNIEMVKKVRVKSRKTKSVS